MGYSREDITLLKTRERGQLVLGCPKGVASGWKDGELTVFVPGRPRNPLNGSHEHWSKRAKWAKGWRERAGAALLKHHFRQGRQVGLWPWKLSDAKRILFTVYGPSRFDDDNLRAVCKPVRDALKDMRIIDDDRDSAGHTFTYTQAKPSRTPASVYGIAIKIQMASDASGKTHA